MLNNEELNFGDIMQIVPSLSRRELRVSLETGANTDELPKDSLAVERLQRLRKEEFQSLPRWMRNERHTALALRLIESPFWLSTPSEARKSFTLRSIQNHFECTDRENSIGPQQFYQRYGKPFVPGKSS